jgi:hypothetical protein
VLHLIWRETAIDAVRKPGSLTITRIFTGPDGLCAEDRPEPERTWRDGDAEGHWSEFSVRPPTDGANPANTGATDANALEWHTGPRVQITLAGGSSKCPGVHVAAGAGTST